MKANEFITVYDDIGDKSFKMKKLYEFPILYAGWELDYKGWIGVDEQNNKNIILTDHGSAYIANENELLEKIKEYQDTISKTEKALQMLKGESE